jgi:hypothetical protein
LDIRTSPIDYQKSMLHLMEDVYEIGVEMILDAVEQLAYRKPLPALPQDEAKSRYYSFPTEEDLDICRRTGIRLVDPWAVQDLLVRSFAPPGSEDALWQVIKGATNQWYSDIRL